MRVRHAIVAACVAACPAATLAGDGADPAVEFDAVYTAEVWRSEGGVEQGWRYLDNLDLTLAADLEAVGIPNTRAFGYVLYNNGASLSELTGDAFAASNIETGVRALRLYEAWIEHDLRPGVSVRAGLYDLNSEFDALETSSLFIGSAHGIGADISQSGENGPSIFPVTSLAARLAVELTESLTVRTAVLDAVPGDPLRPARTAIKLGEGALVIGEADWRIGDVRLLAGSWGYTDRFDRLDGTGMGRSYGAYLRGEGCSPRVFECGLKAFLRLGLASEATNPFERFVSAGLVAELGPAAQLGIAVAHAAGEMAPGRDPLEPLSETALEATLSLRTSARTVIQPNVQFVTTERLHFTQDAQLFGLRLIVEAF